MKKCILFLMSFMFVLFISINAKASITPVGNVGYYGRYGGYYPCHYEAEFDYVIGRDVINSDDLVEDINYIISKTGSPSSINYEGKYRSVDGLNEVIFYCQIKALGGQVNKIEYYVENHLVYELNKQNDNSLKASKNEPVDLNYYAGSRNKLFKLAKSDDYFSCSCDLSESELAQNKFNYFVINFMYGYKVYENNNYIDKDLFFIADSCNPLKEADIISSLDVNDTACGKISASNIEIIDTKYFLNSDYVTPGTYDMTIKAWDDSGNITYQKCKIVSADVTAPVVVSSGTKKAYANTLLTEEEIISCFNAQDEYSNVTIEIENDNYTKNYDKVGNFDVSVIVKDEAGNSTRSSVTVTVLDNNGPVVAYEPIYISSDEKLTEAEIKSYITILDDVDGIITNYDMVDVDDYFLHPNVIGEYQFEISVTDNAGNPGGDVISLYVIDNAGPTIEAPTYTVLLNKGENVTREQILQILKATGQIKSMENTVINSLYFSTLNPEGEYDLEVISDGEVFHDVIKFVDRGSKENIDDDFYNIPIKKEENNKTNYYIILAISVGVIIILSALGVIIYKKKH